jgi:hypothetical protein
MLLLPEHGTPIRIALARAGKTDADVLELLGPICLRMWRTIHPTGDNDRRLQATRARSLHAMSKDFAGLVVRPRLGDQT